MKRPVGRSFRLLGGTPMRVCFWKTESLPRAQDQLSWIQDRCCSRRYIRVRCSGDSHPGRIFSSVDFSWPRTQVDVLNAPLRAGSNTQEGRGKSISSGGQEILGDVKMERRCFVVTVVQVEGSDSPLLSLRDSILPFLS